MVRDKFLPHTLLRFQVHLTNHCNLNCINCSHFSPVANPGFLDVGQYEQDCYRLSELFDGKVEHIFLLGGEPLLHPDVIRVMRLTRQYFPVGRIVLATNGILFTKVSEEFWETCKRCDIEVRPARYPINVKYDEWKKFAKTRGIKYKITDDTKGYMYRRLLSLSADQSIEDAFSRCELANECIQLQQGRMYTCPYAAYASTLNEYFHLEIELPDENSVDIYSVKDADELMHKMAKPIPFCRYCYKGDYADSWRLSGKNIYEYILFEWSSRDIDYLKKQNAIYIWGIEESGRKIFKLLRQSNITVAGFIVMEKNAADFIDGCPVLEIGSVNIAPDSVCMISPPYQTSREIQQQLYNHGVDIIIPIMKFP